jgi:hypothetical protein
VLRFVFAINENNIWFDPWFRWDGQRFNEIPVDPVFIGVRWNKMWGSPNGELYVVGDNGSIAYSSNNGSTWQRVASGTTLDVYDIWGERDLRTGEMEILTIASNVFQNQGARILKIHSNTLTVTQMLDSGLTWGVNALWFAQAKRYYVVGPGIHTKRALHDPIWSVYPPGQVTSYGSSGVSGTNVNDVFVVGSFREVVHFNGVTWKRYTELMPGTDGVFAEGAVKGHSVVIVGFASASQRALALIGRR